jgi:hypothetical protein
MNPVKAVTFDVPVTTSKAPVISPEPTKSAPVDGRATGLH